MLKRTPLFGAHQRLGARLVEFGGWEMPVQYTGIVDEHLAVRNAAGVFDICHMGEFLVEGGGALAFLNSVLTNDLRKCQPGQGQYTLLCQEQGGVVDDLYAYHLEPGQYLLIVNASRIEDDFQWLNQRLALWPDRPLVQLENASDRFGALAIQGPMVSQFIGQCFGGASLAGTRVPEPSHLKKNEIAQFTFEGERVWLARTGYTGEDGFEAVVPASKTEALWQQILERGQSFGLKPCGLGARDTLRTEMGYPLYGHELDLQTTPMEAGLGRFVALDKGEFVGRAVLAEQKKSGLRKKCVAFTLAPKLPPPRPHYPILSQDGQRRIGEVVSGTQSPSLGVGIGLGYVELESSAPGTPLQIEIRGRQNAAVVVPKPIYRKSV